MAVRGLRITVVLLGEAILPGAAVHPDEVGRRATAAVPVRLVIPVPVIPAAVLVLVVALVPAVISEACFVMANSGHDDTASTLVLHFEGLSEAVLLTGSPSLHQLFQRHFSSWPHEERSGRAEGDLLLSVRESSGSVLVSLPDGREERHPSAAAMLCDVGIDLAEAFVRTQPSLSCLHCSAVALDTDDGMKLAVFPNINRAGKSLLASSFILHGGRIFADDLLGVTEQGDGLSFGLPPRLRLPLPPTSQALMQVLPSISGIEDDRYRFLYVDAKDLACFGEQCSIGAFILPRREAGLRPRLRRLTPQAALPWIAYQFQMIAGQAGAVFELARRLCQEHPLWLLEYDSAEDAAQYLTAEAGRVCSPASRSGDEAPLDAVDFLTDDDKLSRTTSRRYAAFPGRKAVRWIRDPDAVAYEEGSRVFLIPKSQDAIFALDRIGQAVWALLAEPLSSAEAASLLAEVFPHTGRGRLERDMTRFFRILFEQGLLRRA